jgi:hypothetical protein
MNIDSIKNGLTQKFGRTGLVLQKHSPEILLGAGLIGMVGTVILASKATLKSQALLDEAKASLKAIDRTAANSLEKNYTDEDVMKAKGMVYVKTSFELAKLYGPSIAIGFLSVASILSSHGVMAKRQVSLVAAYGLLAEGYSKYRARVVEVLGEEKDAEFHLGLREETYSVTEEDETGKKSKVKKSSLVPSGPMPSMYARCFDSSNPMYQSNRLLNSAFLTSQEAYINDVLILEGHVFLNEVYKRLGFPETPEGQLVGWVLRSPEQMKREKRDGYISFGLNKWPANRETMRGENDAIWIDPNVDGIVFNLI